MSLKLQTNPDAERLEVLLRGIPTDELLGLLGMRRLEVLHKLVSAGSRSSIPPAAIPKYAVALEGLRLLDEPAILSSLLLRLDKRHLRKLAREHLETPFERDADNALALASKPLRARSQLSADILGALGISDEPLLEQERRPAVESVEPYDPLPPLLDYQLEVRHQCLEKLKSGSSELLIQMPTGSGKTRTAMEIVVDLVEEQALFKAGRSVVWLAHTEELCEQAIDAFSAVWAQRATARGKVARLWGPYSPGQSDLAGGLVVAGTSRIHSLRKSAPAAFKLLRERCALVVLDEAHRALAPTVVAQINDLRSIATGSLIGLSATPVRGAEAQEENRKLAALFGRNLVTPSLGTDPIGELRRRGILSEVHRVELSYPTAHDDGSEAAGPASTDADSDLPDAILVNLANNVGRNLAIVSAISQHTSKGEPAIVFCCSVDHAHLLAAALRLKGVRSAAVDFRMPRSSRRKTIQEFSLGRVDVLLNFGVLSTGFDAPNVKVVVIARPTRSVVLYSQMLGRGLRGPKMGGTRTCTLIDVRDHLGRFGDLSDLYSQFRPYWTADDGKRGRHEA
jgi:DNA repair protein RadD